MSNNKIIKMSNKTILVKMRNKTIIVKTKKINKNIIIIINTK